MSDRKLTIPDNYMHFPGPQSNWNESRYIDFYDTENQVGGWLRIGMRPNECFAEMSACVNLPDGRTAFHYERAPINGNSLNAGGQSWLIGDPFRSVVVNYAGPMTVLDDPWLLTDPKTAFTSSPRADVRISLRSETEGLDAVMGSDQDHIDQIFLPGQADWHYQHLCWTTGTITIDDTVYKINGAGGKDHSWGPRNWLAKIYLRWLIAATPDRSFGFMLQRAVGPTKEVLGGHIWENGTFRLADRIDINNSYETESPHRLIKTELTVQSGDRTWSATGTPQTWLPLRHRSADEHGNPALLRIVKSPTKWIFGDKRIGEGMCEIHDRIDDNGVPAGLHD